MTKNGLLMRLKREVRKLPPNLIEEYCPEMEAPERAIRIGVVPSELRPWLALRLMKEEAISFHVKMSWATMQGSPADIVSTKKEIDVLNLHLIDLYKQAFPEINHRGIDSFLVSKDWCFGVIWRQNAPTSYTHQ